MMHQVYIKYLHHAGYSTLKQIHGLAFLPPIGSTIIDDMRSGVVTGMTTELSGDFIVTTIKVEINE